MNIPASPGMQRAQRVAALVGRRIDAPDARTPRFPLQRRAAVTRDIAQILRRDGIELLISSAACGADLAAIDAAISLDVRCGIVLPFARARFRATSVVDRPGEWGEAFDHAVAYAQTSGFVRELADGGDDDAAYARANEAIMDEARRAAALQPPIAIVVWEGRSRGDDDLTAHFLQLAQRAGFEQRVVQTLPRG
jgi:hypothetical protein